MAEWKNPKTDWKETDFMTATDYNRLVNNLLFLKDYIAKVYPTSALDSMVSKNVLSGNYAEEFNAIENNIERINSQSYNFPIGLKKQYTENDYLPTYDEINRIESALLQIYTQYYHRRDNVPKLALEHLGRPKGF